MRDASRQPTHQRQLRAIDHQLKRIGTGVNSSPIIWTRLNVFQIHTQKSVYDGGLKMGARQALNVCPDLAG